MTENLFKRLTSDKYVTSMNFKKDEKLSWEIVVT